jgi:hypothetical protein
LQYIYSHCKQTTLTLKNKKAILEQSTAILEQPVILVNLIFYAETFEEDFMYGFKLGWIVPVIVLTILITVMGVGIYQLNSEKNPWDFGGSSSASGWDFLERN